MVDKQTSMRDAFFDKLYEIAKQDRDVILVSADMGAPSLDKFRRDLSSQYLNVGIAEENMILVAAGLAMSGKKVWVYAIQPFTTSRCYEFIKLDISLMNIPITIVGIGSGYSYDDSGPTHHTTEDITIMRVLPNLELLNPSDSRMAEVFASYSYKADNPVYVRLDRKTQPLKYDPSESFNEGFKELMSGDEICILTTGNMVTEALEVSDHFSKKGIRIGVVDIYRLKPLNSESLKKCINKYSHLVSWEEHLLDGGFGSIISEFITDNSLPLKLKRIGVKDKYVYLYGGRKNIQEKLDIDTGAVIKEINKIISNMKTIVKQKAV